MSLSATSMAAKVETYIAAVPPHQQVGGGSINSYRHDILVAMCQGIIDEITENAVVHTVDNVGNFCNNGTIT